MIRTQYAQLDLFESILPPEVVRLNEELSHIDLLLQDERFMQPFLTKFSKCMGRPTIPLQTFLRMMYLKHRHQLGFETLIQEVGDSIMWRRFCQIPLLKPGVVPHPTTLSKHCQLFGDTLIQELNRLLVQKAVETKLIRARKLRVDTTVVESNVHYPTDAGLLQDEIRTITRIAKQLTQGARELVTHVQDRTRTVRKKVFSIHKVLKRRTQEAVTEVREITGEILDVTQEVVRSGWTLLQEASQKLKETPSRQLIHYVPRLERALETTEQILFQTQQIQQGERHIRDRVVSLTDPEARPIAKGKLHKKVEFGYKVLLEETEDRVVVGYSVYKGNPNDETLLEESMNRFKDTMGRVPRSVATDRGFSSKSNEQLLKERGVKRISLPVRGRKSKERQAIESSSWFRSLQHFRAGGEARISVLKRRYNMDRSLFRGKRGTGAWVGYAVFAHNLNH